MKLFAPAGERNAEPIARILAEVLPVAGEVLEIGSGTGQHAVYFASRLPGLVWQPTDRAGALASIEAWRSEAALANVRPALALDLADESWPVARADAVVCINTIHIVAWELVKRLFAGVGRVLADGGVMYVYGPYRYADRPLEPSNVEFDHWLTARDPASGVRDFDAVDELARRHGLVLAGDRAMPSNNRSIWWRKGAGDALP